LSILLYFGLHTRLDAAFQTHIGVMTLKPRRFGCNRDKNAIKGFVVVLNRSIPEQ